MRPMSVREMDALCYERGIEFDPALRAPGAGRVAEVMLAHPAWDGHSRAGAATSSDRRTAAAPAGARTGSQPRTWSGSRGSGRPR